MYGASTISLRNAFYTLGTTAHGGSKRSRFNYLAWTQDNGGHLSPSLGNKYAAELFFHWVRRVAERSPAPSADALGLPTTWYHLPVGGVRGGARGYSALAAPAQRCYTFDDDFNGLLSAPRVLNASAGWRLTSTETGTSGEVKRKPGYRASARGAVLRLSTLQSGAQKVQVGFLASPRSLATAALTCEAGCTCARLELSAHDSRGVSTTRFSDPHAAVAAGEQPCELALRLTSDREDFKLIALHVAEDAR